MRSKLLLLFLFIGFCFTESCKYTGGGRFTVSGTIQNTPPCTVVLEELGVNDVITQLDSDKLDDKGKFDLSGNAPEPGIYRLHFGKNKYLMLSVEKGGDIKINGDWNALERSQITGSASTASLQQFLTTVRSNMRDFNTMSIVLDSLQTRGNDSVYAAARTDMRNMQEKFTKMIENYADTTVYLSNAIFAARFLNPRVEKDFLSGFIQGLYRRFPNSPKVKDFDNFYAQVLGGGKAKPGHQGMVGGIAPELKLAEANGTIVSLSSLRGKYVLLDFWASWCGPCRAENPNVVAAYNKYKEKNFIVYSVSLDNNKESWLKAINDDKLDWPTHVSDLAGWNSAAAKTYNVESIPTNFLIDPSGKIIARDLRGDMLEQQLAAVLK